MNYRFYAVFTTNQNGLTGSAVCTFDINSMESAFNGKFKVFISIISIKTIMSWPFA